MAKKQYIDWNYSNFEDYCKDLHPYQSPINIESPFVYQDPCIQFQYQTNIGPLSLFNENDNNLKMAGDFGQFVYEGKQVFSASQITFHSPSEHTFTKDYKRYPLEIQIYHEDQDNHKAILSVFFEVGEDDCDFLARLGFDPDQNPKLIGDPDEYLMYSGTTTTPPCESDVMWIILSQTRTISQRQLTKFPKRLAEDKYRALQDRSQREIRISFKDESDSKLLEEAGEEVEKNIFWASSKLEMPSYSLNGLVIDHEEGYTPAVRQATTQGDELSKLAQKQLNKLYQTDNLLVKPNINQLEKFQISLEKDESQGSSYNIVNIPKIDEEYEDERELQERRLQEEREREMILESHQIIIDEVQRNPPKNAPNTIISTQEIEEKIVMKQEQKEGVSEADEVFSNFMSEFFDDKSPPRKFLAQSNSPLTSFVQLSSTQQSTEKRIHNLNLAQVSSQGSILDDLILVKKEDVQDANQNMISKITEILNDLQKQNLSDELQNKITLILIEIDRIRITRQTQSLDQNLLKQVYDLLTGTDITNLKQVQSAINKAFQLMYNLQDEIVQGINQINQQEQIQNGDFGGSKIDEGVTSGSTVFDSLTVSKSDVQKTSATLFKELTDAVNAYNTQNENEEGIKKKMIRYLSYLENKSQDEQLDREAIENLIKEVKTSENIDTLYSSIRSTFSTLIKEISDSYKQEQIRQLDVYFNEELIISIPDILSQFTESQNPEQFNRVIKQIFETILINPDEDEEDLEEESNVVITAEDLPFDRLTPKQRTKVIKGLQKFLPVLSEKQLNVKTPLSQVIDYIIEYDKTLTENEIKEKERLAEEERLEKERQAEQERIDRENQAKSEAKNQRAEEIFELLDTIIQRDNLNSLMDAYIKKDDEKRADEQLTKTLKTIDSLVAQDQAQALLEEQESIKEFKIEQITSLIDNIVQFQEDNIASIKQQQTNLLNDVISFLDKVKLENEQLAEELRQEQQRKEEEEKKKEQERLAEEKRLEEERIEKEKQQVIEDEKNQRTQQVFDIIDTLVKRDNLSKLIDSYKKKDDEKRTDEQLTKVLKTIDSLVAQDEAQAIQEEQESLKELRIDQISSLLDNIVKFQENNKIQIKLEQDNLLNDLIGFLNLLKLQKEEAEEVIKNIPNSDDIVQLLNGYINEQDKAEKEQKGIEIDIILNDLDSLIDKDQKLKVEQQFELQQATQGQLDDLYSTLANFNKENKQNIPEKSKVSLDLILEFIDKLRELKLKEKLAINAESESQNSSQVGQVDKFLSDLQNENKLMDLLDSYKYEQVEQSKKEREQDVENVINYLDLLIKQDQERKQKIFKLDDLSLQSLIDLIDKIREFQKQQAEFMSQKAQKSFEQVLAFLDELKAKEEEKERIKQQEIEEQERMIKDQEEKERLQKQEQEHLRQLEEQYNYERLQADLKKQKQDQIESANEYLDDLKQSDKIDNTIEYLDDLKSQDQYDNANEFLEGVIQNDQAKRDEEERKRLQIEKEKQELNKQKQVNKTNEYIDDLKESDQIDNTNQYLDDLKSQDQVDQTIEFVDEKIQDDQQRIEERLKKEEQQRLLKEEEERLKKIKEQEEFDKLQAELKEQKQNQVNSVGDLIDQLKKSDQIGMAHKYLEKLKNDDQFQQTSEYIDGVIQDVKSNREEQERLAQEEDERLKKEEQERLAQEEEERLRKEEQERLAQEEEERLRKEEQERLAQEEDERLKKEEQERLAREEEERQRVLREQEELERQQAELKKQQDNQVSSASQYVDDLKKDDQVDQASEFVDDLKKNDVQKKLNKEELNAKAIKIIEYLDSLQEKDRIRNLMDQLQQEQLDEQQRKEAEQKLEKIISMLNSLIENDQQNLINQTNITISDQEAQSLQEKSPQELQNILDLIDNFRLQLKQLNEEKESQQEDQSKEVANDQLEGYLNSLDKLQDLKQQISSTDTETETDTVEIDQNETKVELESLKTIDESLESAKLYVDMIKEEKQEIEKLDLKDGNIFLYNNLDEYDHLDKDEPQQIAFKPAWLENTIDISNNLMSKTYDIQQKNGEVQDSIENFSLNKKLDSQAMTHQKYMDNQNYTDLPISKNKKIKNITLDEIIEEAQPLFNEKIPLLKMGEINANIVADRDSNAFEIKYNDIDVQNAIDDSFTQIKTIRKSKQLKSIEGRTDSLVKSVSKYYDMEQSSHQDATREMIKGDPVQRELDEYVKINDEKSLTFLDDYLKQKDTDGFINRNIQPEKQFNNQQLVNTALLNGQFLVSGVRENLPNHNNASIDLLLNTIENNTIEDVRNELFEGNNNNKVYAEEIKFLPVMRDQKDKRLSEDENEILSTVLNIAEEQKEKSDETVGNLVQYQYDASQKDEMQIRVLESNFEITNKDFVYKDEPQMHLETNINKLVNQELKKEANQQSNKDLADIFKSDLEGKLQRQIDIDQFMEDKWDDSSIASKSDLVDTMIKNLNDKDKENKKYTIGDSSVKKTQEKSELVSKNDQIDNNELVENSIDFTESKSQLLSDDICKTGLKQSPINIQGPFQVEDSQDKITYSFTDTSMITPKFIRDMKTGLLFVQGSWGTVEYHGENYKMYGLYIHNPSEHTFGQDKLRSDMEIQLLFYSSSSSRILMISLLYDLTNTLQLENQFINSLNLKQFLSNPGLQDQTLNSEDLKLRDLVGGDLEQQISLSYYIRYEGSLTQMPCTENVTWIIVLNKFNNLSPIQLGDLKLISGQDMNIRSIQPTNLRTVYIS